MGEAEGWGLDEAEGWGLGEAEGWGLGEAEGWEDDDMKNFTIWLWLVNPLVVISP